MVNKSHVKNGKLGKIKDNIKSELNKYGVDAVVKWRRSGVPGKYWFYIISRDFEEWNLSERQNVVWRILEKSLAVSELVKITMVFTWTEKEARGDFS